MIGEIVSFGGGRTPPAGSDEKLLADAKACFAEHDPFRPVLDYLDQVSGRLDQISERLTQPPQVSNLTLDEAQLKTLTSALDLSTRRSVRLESANLSRWRATLVGAICAAGLIVGAAITYGVMRNDAAEALAAARIEVPAVFGSLSAADAASWGKLMRENPPVGVLLGRAQPITNETRGRAVSLGVWIDPPKPVMPGTR
jgi:hypothetical protein